MKKLIAVLTLFLAFAAGANAQEAKKMNAEDAAKNEAIQLSQTVGLNATQQQDFVRLFMMKFKVMNDDSKTAEQKAKMSQIVEAKMKATLTAEQMQKLDADPKLKAKLTSSDAVPKK